MSRRFLYLCIAVLLAGMAAWSFVNLARASTQITTDYGSRPSQIVDEAYTIILWHASKGDREAHLLEMVDEFNTTFPTITVQAKKMGTSSTNLYNNIMDNIKSGDEVPNLTFAYPNMVWNLARFDVVRFLDDFVDDPSNGIDTTDYYTASLNDNRLSEYNDQLAALPYVLSAMDVMFYNADLLTTTGITVPKTWDEFYTACVSLTTDTVSGTVLHSNSTHLIDLLWSFGGELYSADLKHSMIDDQFGIAAMQFYRDLLDGGYARMQDVEVNKYERQNAFADGKTAFVFMSSSSIPFIRQAIADSGDVVTDWRVARMPADPGNENVFVASNNLVMLRSTPDKESAAWQFMRWFTQPEQSAKLANVMNNFPIRISASTHPSMTEKLATDPQYAQAFALIDQDNLGKNQQVLRGIIEIYAEYQAAMDGILYDDLPITDTLETHAANLDAILALTGPDAATITPGGGTLIYTNTQGLQTTVEFPANAVSTTTVFAYLPLSDLPSQTLSFALVPNMEFNTPVTVTVQYRDSDVDGLDEENLVFYNYDWPTNQYVDTNPCGGYVRDPENNRLSASVCHFSDHAMMVGPYSIYMPLVLR